MKYPSSPNPFSQFGRRGTGAQVIDIAHRAITGDSIVGWAMPTTLVFIDFHDSTLLQRHFVNTFGTSENIVSKAL
jgi:hypothetical protein